MRYDARYIILGKIIEASDNGWPSPSYPDLERAAGCSRDVVHRYIHDLIRRGVINRSGVMQSYKYKPTDKAKIELKYLETHLKPVTERTSDGSAR